MPTSTAPWKSASRSSRSNAAKIDGIKISLLDKDREIAHAAATARRRAHVHRRRFQFRRVDRRRRLPAIRTRCSASSTRSRLRPRRRWPRSPRGIAQQFDAILAPTVPLVAPCVRRADALLQDGRRLSRVAQRQADAFRHGRRPAKRAQSHASGRAFPRLPTPRACSPIRRWRCTPDADLARNARLRWLSGRRRSDRSCRTHRADERARFEPAFDQHRDGARAVERCPRSSPAARGAASAASRPGATRSPRPA